MTNISIEALAREQLKAARHTGARRAADTVFGGHEKVLRQTVVGLLDGAKIGERVNLDEATIYVIEGRVQLWVGENCWEARPGSLLILPKERHQLIAIEDSALLITVAKLPAVTGDSSSSPETLPAPEPPLAEPTEPPLSSPVTSTEPATS